MKNKYQIYLYLFLPCLLTGFFILSNFSEAGDASIIISAIQTSGLDPNDDFLELYNSTCTDINLSDWKLKKRTKSGSETSIGTLKNAIPAKGYYLWENTSKNLADNPDYSTKTYYLANDYSVALYDKTGEQIDSITWGENTNPFSPTHAYPSNLAKSESILRTILNELSKVINYFPKNSNIIETAEFNSCPKEPEPPKQEAPKIYTKNIVLSELLPYPITDNEEFIELYNPDATSLDLTGWILHDDSKSGKYTFPPGATIEAIDYLVVYKKDFKFALNNSGNESVTLYDPSENVISKATYISAKEGISYNFDGAAWRWSKFLTPGAKNIFNNLPQAKNEIPKKVYVGTYADFFVQGSDKDNDKLKYTWDFGDGHKSYLQTTRHKYEKVGKYMIVLKINDGSEDKIETFEIEVEKFPKLDVNIIGLSANPQGIDTDAEYIILKSTSKKKINLKGWSIATGNKKTLTNHPINVDLIIKPGKEIKLTHVYSKFTLHNKASHIELRYPNGKVASHMKYATMDKSIADDEIYEKTKSGWVWKKPVVLTNEIAPSVPADSASEPEPESVSTVVPSEEILPEPAIEDLGKFSPSPDWENKQKTKFSLLNFGFQIKTASADSGQKGIRIASRTETPTRKHWIIKLRDDFFLKINLLLNKIIMSF